MNTLHKEFITQTIVRMDESTARIKKCLDQLSEEEIWKKPNSSLNGVANLILHLCGNIRQYAIASLGNQKDERQRDEEFAASSGYNKSELFQKLTITCEEAKKVMRSLDEKELERIRRVQIFDLSGMGIMIHVVEHYSYHTGQIAFWTKLLKEKDLGFYEKL